MIATTTLLGELAKALSGNGQQEAGDTALVVPGLLQPVLKVPIPMQVVYTVPQPINVQQKSFILSDLEVFTGGDVNKILCFLAPGLWHISFAHWIEAEGAATADGTAGAQLNMALIEGNNPSTFLTRAVPVASSASRYNDGEFWSTVPSPNQLEFLHQIENGGGVSTYRSFIRLICTRFL